MALTLKMDDHFKANPIELVIEGDTAEENPDQEIPISLTEYGREVIIQNAKGGKLKDFIIYVPSKVTSADGFLKGIEAPKANITIIFLGTPKSAKWMVAMSHFKSVTVIGDLGRTNVKEMFAMSIVDKVNIQGISLMWDDFLQGATIKTLVSAQANKDLIQPQQIKEPSKADVQVVSSNGLECVKGATIPSSGTLPPQMILPRKVLASFNNTPKKDIHYDMTIPLPKAEVIDGSFGGIKSKEVRIVANNLFVWGAANFHKNENVSVIQLEATSLKDLTLDITASSLTKLSLDVGESIDYLHFYLRACSKSQCSAMMDALASLAPITNKKLSLDFVGDLEHIDLRPLCELLSEKIRLSIWVNPCLKKISIPKIGPLVKDFQFHVYLSDVEHIKSLIEWTDPSNEEKVTFN